MRSLTIQNALKLCSLYICAHVIILTKKSEIIQWVPDLWEHLEIKLWKTILLLFSPYFFPPVFSVEEAKHS